MQVFENFISYRRRESMLEVKNIYDALQTRGYSTFCDVYSLGSGEFNQDLITAIDHCTNFILVLGAHSMERCSDDEDWLYCEIREALEKKKNIICVFTDDVHFPAELPRDIDNIRFQNGLKFDVFYFDKFIDHLISNFMVSEETRSESDAEKDFIIIQDVLVKYVGNARIVSIPSGVRIIGRNAFKNQTKITKLIIPEGVVEIQESAFERCSLIPYITLPKSLRIIGGKAFCRCYNLAYIAFDDELKEIGSEAFGFCGKLKTISLNKELERISSTAFNNCSQLMEFVIAEDNSHYSVQDGILYDYDQVVAVRCPENYNRDVVELPKTIKTIGEWCFSRCMKLIDIVLPRKLENVCSHAFHDSCNIASLTLGDSIKEFDISALDGWNDRQRIIMGRKFHPVIKYSIEQRMKELNPVERKVIGYQFCLVKTAFEAEEEAIKMAKMLLDNSLIVSGQIKRMRSLYMWEDELCNENEVELTCFTESRLYPEVEEFINSHHSYELCQLICLPIINISDGFGKWISDCTGKIKFED
jgi:uncharacterized protein involved in tolerance to divalent cations